MSDKQILRLIERFEAAVRDDEMRGSYDPEIREDIHEAYKEAKRKLRAALYLPKPRFKR